MRGGRTASDSTKEHWRRRWSGAEGAVHARSEQTQSQGCRAGADARDRVAVLEWVNHAGEMPGDPLCDSMSHCHGTPRLMLQWGSRSDRRRKGEIFEGLEDEGMAVIHEIPSM